MRVVFGFKLVVTDRDDIEKIDTVELEILYGDLFERLCIRTLPLSFHPPDQASTSGYINVEPAFAAERIAWSYPNRPARFVLRPGQRGTRKE